MQTINDLKRRRHFGTFRDQRRASERLRDRRLSARRRAVVGGPEKFRSLHQAGQRSVSTPSDYGGMRARPWVVSDWAPSAAEWWKRAHPARALQDVLLAAWRTEHETSLRTDPSALAETAAMEAAMADWRRPLTRPDGWAAGHPDQDLIIGLGFDLEGDPEDIAQCLGCGVVRRARMVLDSTSFVWQEQPVPRANRMITIAPLHAPSLVWQEMISGLWRYQSQYRYVVSAAENGCLTAAAARPLWSGSRMADPVLFPRAAYLARTTSGRSILHKALLIRTLIILDAEAVTWRPFSDRVVTVWPDGEALCTDLRGESAAPASSGSSEYD